MNRIKILFYWVWVRLAVKWATPEEIAAEEVTSEEVKVAMKRFHDKCDELKKLKN